MKGESIPRENHVIRYVKPRSIDIDGVSREEFLLRPDRADERGLSVNWLEYYSDLDKQGQIAAVRQCSRLTLKRTGRYAEFGVYDLHYRLQTALDHFDIVHAPIDDGTAPPDPSHSEILGLPPGDSPFAHYVAALIADGVMELYPIPDSKTPIPSSGED